jgi:FkbM family methyltransferase|tara:strand:- start:95 stop:790 length:696 start_codon:yes stop_codon:yes gene_type:complete
MPKVFVHFGAGAGDNDKGAFFRCGFTEFVKKNCSSDDKIFCVEANKHNIRYLRNTYKNFKNVKIYNLGLSTKNSNKIEFFYTDKDAPHFQVTSIKKKHVIKHYPNQIIKSFFVKAITPNKFFKKINQNKIDYLSIDIEGIDFEILMSINLKNILVNNISIEYLHLSKFQRRKLIYYLANQGYSYCGNGYDHNNYDYLFSRKKIYWNILISKLFLWFTSPKHYKYFNYFILK